MKDKLYNTNTNLSFNQQQMLDQQQYPQEEIHRVVSEKLNTQHSLKHRNNNNVREQQLPTNAHSVERPQMSNTNMANKNGNQYRKAENKSTIN